MVHLYTIAWSPKKWELAMRIFEFSNTKSKYAEGNWRTIILLIPTSIKHTLYVLIPSHANIEEKKLIFHTNHVSSNTSICGSKWVVKMIRTIIYYSLSYNWMFSTISYFSSLRPNFFLHTLPSSLFLSHLLLTFPPFQS